jgi:exonuclease SbcC
MAESTAAAYAVERAAIEAARSQRADQLQDEDRTADELADAVREGRLERDTMREAAAVLTTLDERTASALAECESLQSGLAGARDDATRTGAALATLEGDLSTEQLELERLVADHAQCPCAQGPCTGRDSRTSTLDLASLRETHDEAVWATHAYGEALRRELAAAEERESVLAESQSALAAAGFADAEAARAAQLSREQLAELRRTTTDWEQELRAAQAVLDDPEVRAAVEAPELDLASLGAARDLARSDLLRTSSQDVLLRRTVDALDRVRPGIVARCADIEATTTNHLMIRELADTLGGGGSNILRMRLSAFVLAARLEKVVILANERLAAMGDGRYQLQHSDGLAARGARSGLGLAVLDLWTGQTRDTSSLSGGESFMASLALALGLADAVREEAGGFDLQTLFVDEGFGTLDDESLEQVMDVLDALREGGRAVGVVSHVAELRSRIPSQVVVSKTERGSSAQFAAAEGAAPAA